MKKRSASAVPVRAAKKPAAKAHAGRRPSAKSVQVPAKTGTLVAELRTALGVTQPTMARLSGFSLRTIADWESGRKPSEAGRQRMAELTRLYRSLAEIMERDYIAEWLTTPNDAFEGKKPIEVIERGEIDRVWQMIFLLRSGATV